MDEVVVRGKLKLKKHSGVGKKKPKTKAISKEKIEAMVAAGEDSDDARASGSSPFPVPRIMKTKAEMAFEKRQAKIQEERIKEKAHVSHRDRVEKFNKYLENMTEINDIPKVSWTK